MTPRRIDTRSAATSVAFATAMACAIASAGSWRAQHRHGVADAALGAESATRSMREAGFAGGQPQTGDRFVEQAQHLLNIVRAIPIMIARPRREPAPGVNGHVETRLRILGENDRVQRRGDLARERRVIGLARWWPCSAKSAPTRRISSVAIQLTADTGRLTT